MYLEYILDSNEGRKITRLDKASCTYSVMYKYWRNSLFERVMRLFVWEDTGDLDPKEIEQRLILKGHVGICEIPKDKRKFQKDGVIAMFGTLYGYTEYIDEFTNYMVHSPVYSGSKTIGKDIVVINNNALRNPTYDLIHHYATLLGHTEVSLINLLINARDSGGVPVVATEKQKASVREYQNQLFNGQYGIVTDIGNLGINYMGSDRHTNQEIMSIMETREKLIKSFYSDIGVRSSFEKRNNTVQAEVEADTSLLLLNLSDMLKQREDGCEQVNEMFGTNWSVHVAEEIDYGAENQRDQFDTSTETHIAEEETQKEDLKNVKGIK